MSVSIKSLLVLTLLVLAQGPLRAEKAIMSPEAMARISTHIVIGEIKAITTRVEKAGGYEKTHFVAEVKITKVEKGDDLKADQLVYVRYWQKHWVGRGMPPTGTNGHRGLPAAGDSKRIYLARNAYNGLGESHDGGFDVIGCDGFQNPS